MVSRPDIRLVVRSSVTVIVATLALGAVAPRADDAERRPDPRPGPACAGPVVALTFDDGPSRDNARQLADVLARNDVPATFFMTGRSAAARPRRVRRFATDGHRIYNHTYDHVDLTGTSDAEIRRQLTSTRRALRQLGVGDGRLVRPPYGRIDRRVRRVLRGMGYRSVRWTVDTHDWDRSRTADQIHRAVATGLEPRANILLHDKEDSDATMAALPRIIRTVRGRGYCFGIVDRRGRVVRAARS